MEENTTKPCCAEPTASASPCCEGTSATPESASVPCCEGAAVNASTPCCEGTSAAPESASVPCCEGANPASCCDGDKTAPALSPEEQLQAEEELAHFAKALGHPARIRILRLLMERESCVCGELVEAMPLAQATVSQHLKVLKEAGLVKGTVEGPRVCYCIDREGLTRFQQRVPLLSVS